MLIEVKVGRSQFEGEAMFEFASRLKYKGSSVGLEHVPTPRAGVFRLRSVGVRP